MPVPIAAAILFLLPRYLDRDEAASGFSLRKLDFPGTATLAATMLGLVYTVVEAPTVGWDRLARCSPSSGWLRCSAPSC